MSQVNFCPECGCHFVIPNPNFCNNCGLQLMLSSSYHPQYPCSYECQPYVQYPMSNPQPKKPQSKPRQQQQQQSQQQSKPQSQQQSKPQSQQSQQKNPNICTRCKNNYKAEGFSWCQSCYDNRQASNANVPQCNSCDRRVYYDKKTGVYSNLCTKHYNEFNKPSHN